MIKGLWQQIIEKQDVRQSLSKIRQEIKKNDSSLALSYLMAGQEMALLECLKSEDAKTRKNAALLMGEVGQKEFLVPLYEAYEAETQLFVKSSYLVAMQNFDYRPYLEQLKEHLNQLIETELADDNRKHLTEEIHILTEMVMAVEGVKKHKFAGIDESYDVILLTNRNFQDVTASELAEQEPYVKQKTFGAGIQAHVGNLAWTDEVRTYQELLFVIKGMTTCEMDAEEAARVIAGKELMDFLQKAHKGKVPFYFRVEFKSKMDLGKRSAFTKKLAAEIERLSNRRLINTTSNYELEIRLIENKKGGCNILVKLYTLEDHRFDYRREVTASCMKPVNAALTVALAKKYMKEDAQVLDPFCGVGTLLIERHKAVRANTTYGIDYNEDAIEKARINTEAAHQIIHYINRNFLDFKHDYLFDEIITEMPFAFGRTSEEEIEELYLQFFPAAEVVLKEQGIVILYTRDKELVRRYGTESGFKLLEEFEISKREGAYVMILQRK